MISGVAALMLEANSNLSWRDVRYILASTAYQNDSLDPGWSKNGAGFHIHHSYGFGLVDATASVAASENWTNLPQTITLDAYSDVNRIIPDNEFTGTEDQLVIDDSIIVEFVDIVFDAPTHSRVGDLAVTLTSPNGTISRLSERHNQIFETFRYTNWRFGSLRHLGEYSKGAWRLKVQDLREGAEGIWKSWRLIIHGHRIS